MDLKLERPNLRRDRCEPRHRPRHRRRCWRPKAAASRSSRGARTCSTELADEIAAAGHRRGPIVIAEDLTADGVTERIRERVLAEFGGLDVLVNNAGSSRPVPWNATEEQWHEGMRLNFELVRRLTNEFIPTMRAQASAASSTSRAPTSRPASTSRRSRRRRCTTGRRACRASSLATASRSTACRRAASTASRFWSACTRRPRTGARSSTRTFRSASSASPRTWRTSSRSWRRRWRATSRAR